jgi:hypothetical protein
MRVGSGEQVDIAKSLLHNELCRLSEENSNGGEGETGHKKLGREIKKERRERGREGMGMNRKHDRHLEPPKAPTFCSPKDFSE